MGWPFQGVTAASMPTRLTCAFVRTEKDRMCDNICDLAPLPRALCSMCPSAVQRRGLIMREKSLCGRAPANVTSLQLQVEMQVIIMLQGEASTSWSWPHRTSLYGDNAESCMLRCLSVFTPEPFLSLSLTLRDGASSNERRSSLLKNLTQQYVRRGRKKKTQLCRKPFCKSPPGTPRRSLTLINGHTSLYPRGTKWEKEVGVSFSGLSPCMLVQFLSLKRSNLQLSNWLLLFSKGRGPHLEKGKYLP